MSDQLFFDFDSNGVRPPKAARPFGPWPVEADGVTVAIPIRSRFADSGIAWTTVDRSDYPIAMSRRWHVVTSGYAIAHDDRGRVQIALHNLILPPTPGLLVDHRKRDRLDNRRASLRHVSASVNAANRETPRAGRSSRYRGVTLHRQTGKWQAAATHKGRCLYAGLYEREEDAAGAYDRIAARTWPGIIQRNIPINSEDSIVNRTITFSLERETKGAVRYQEVNGEGKPLEQADSVVGTIYLRKTALDGKIPERVTVTITSEAA